VVVALAIGINAKSGDGCKGFFPIGLQCALSDPNIDRGRVNNEIAFWLQLGIARTEHEIFTARALIRSQGQAAILF